MLHVTGRDIPIISQFVDLYTLSSRVASVSDSTVLDPMSSRSMVSVSLSTRGKKVPALPKVVSTYHGATISELVSILSQKTGLSVHRFRLTEDGKVLTSSDTIDSDVTLTVKDLGPQLGWRTVYIIEYLGPLILHPLIFFLLKNEKSPAQYVTLLMITLHFIKREYETIYVHRFSSETMPAFNLFKNCAYYWFVGGASLAAVTYSSFYGPAAGQEVPSSEALAAFPRFPMFLFTFAELCNFKTHTILRDLRPAGSTQRKIPRGLGFDLVSCPNYFFEILAWIAISAVTNSLASWAFTIVGAVQMWFWAIKRHRRYKKEFSEYPKDRKVLIPFLL